MKLLNTNEVAEKLKVSAIRVRQLIRQGRITATKVGRDYVIQASDLKGIAKRKNGRPKKVVTKK